MPSVDQDLEQGRLSALDRHDLLDTPQEEAFDRITRLACRVLNVPIATVTLLDAHRQWFKSRQGLDISEGDRGESICAIAIRQSAPLVVPDISADPRFAENPLVLGPPHLRFYAGLPLKTREGHAIGTLCAMDTQARAFGTGEVDILCDLGRLVLNEFELRLLAATDALTGALSRRAFREDAGRLLALALRHHHETSLIAFDLDHFKAVNDVHGHVAGDAVLADCIEVCQRLLRQTDLIGRLGGEEFAILLPHTGRQAALAVAEKLRAGFAELTFAGRNGPFGVTASFGVATLDRASDIDALLEHADQALYAAKDAGRNCCLPWLPTQESEPVNGRRVLKAGQIVFNRGQSVIDCTVRRLSDKGASIAVISSAGVPDRFKLHIAAEDMSRLCQIVSKADRQLEVAFAA